MVHLFQETTPGMESCKNGYHNVQFVAVANEIGLCVFANVIVDHLGVLC